MLQIEIPAAHGTEVTHCDWSSCCDWCHPFWWRIETEWRNQQKSGCCAFSHVFCWLIRCPRSLKHLESHHKVKKKKMMRNSKFKSLLCILTWTNFSLAVSPVFTHWDRGLTTFWDAAVWLCTEFFYHIPGPESRVAFEVEIWQLVMTSHDEVHSLMCLELYWRVRIAVLLRVAVEVFSSSVQVHPERFRTFWKPLKYSCENKLVRIVWWCRVHGFANYRISFWNCLCEGRPLPFEVLLWVWYFIEGLVLFE